MKALLYITVVSFLFKPQLHTANGHRTRKLFYADDISGGWIFFFFTARIERTDLSFLAENITRKEQNWEKTGKMSCLNCLFLEPITEHRLLSLPQPSSFSFPFTVYWSDQIKSDSYTVMWIPHKNFIKDDEGTPRWELPLVRKGNDIPAV